MNTTGWIFIGTYVGLFVGLIVGLPLRYARPQSKALILLLPPVLSAVGALLFGYATVGYADGSAAPVTVTAAVVGLVQSLLIAFFRPMGFSCNSIPHLFTVNMLCFTLTQLIVVGIAVSNSIRGDVITEVIQAIMPLVLCTAIVTAAAIAIGCYFCSLKDWVDENHRCRAEN